MIAVPTMTEDNIVISLSLSLSLSLSDLSLSPLLQCDNGALRHSPLIRRLDKLHHLLYVLLPLKVKAVDKEQWLVNSRHIDDILVNGNHPSVQSDPTPAYSIEERASLVLDMKLPPSIDKHM